MATINISLPASMYKDAKLALKTRGYASISELIRSALRGVLYPHVTENGFTPEFEEEVLRSDAEPVENSVKWDGKTPFVEFVLAHPPKHARHKIHQSVLRSSGKTSRSTSRTHTKHKPAHSAVSKESERYAAA